MRDLTIGKNEAGQRMDKYLKKYFPEAGSGFLYKMLRKKNILLNEKKADGKEMLKQGDTENTGGLPKENSRCETGCDL